MLHAGLIKMKHINTQNEAFNTVANYILDPLLSPHKMKDYETIKPPPEHIHEFNKALSNIAAYKKMPLQRLHTMSDGTITKEAAYYLYHLIRTQKPEIILETGISYGFSTAIILSALNANKFGSLYSTDIHNEVGIMTWSVDKSRWHKCIGKPKTILKDTLKKIKKPIDMFLHDSDHSYASMFYEYKTVFPYLSPTAYLMSDDVNDNSAFLDFCNKKELKPCAIYSSLKLFGVTRLAGQF